MSRFSVAVIYFDNRKNGEITYKLRQGIVEANTTAEALGKYLIDENPKNYGNIMTFAVNYIEELSKSEGEPNEQLQTKENQT